MKTPVVDCRLKFPVHLVEAIDRSNSLCCCCTNQWRPNSMMMPAQSMRWAGCCVHSAVTILPGTDCVVCHHSSASLRNFSKRSRHKPPSFPYDMGQDTHICLGLRLEGPSRHPDDLAMKAHPFRNRKVLCLLSKKFCTFRCGWMSGEVENTCPVSDDFCLESAWRRMRRSNEVCWGVGLCIWCGVK